MNKTEAISPKKIYLQVDPEGEKPDQWSDAGDVTWCADKINNNDVEYIRTDLSEQYAQQVSREDKKKTALAFYDWMCSDMGIRLGQHVDLSNEEWYDDWTKNQQ